MGVVTFTRKKHHCIAKKSSFMDFKLKYLGEL